MQRNEHRKHPRGLADLLLPYALIDNGVLLQQDGSLLAGWSYRGPDMNSAVPTEMDALSARLNHVLRLGSGWMVQCDAIRSLAPGYPKRGAFPDPITKLIDDERREQFMAARAHFESEYFLTLTYLPPPEVEERAKGWLFEGRDKYSSEKAAAQHLERFRNKVDHFENVFGTLFQTERLRMVVAPDDFGSKHIHDRLLRYLRRCISGVDHPFAMPEIPCYLNEILACEDFYGGTEPRIGRKHIRVVAIDGFPRMSSPGILRALDQLPIEYRWNERALLVDSEEVMVRTADGAAGGASGVTSEPAGSVRPPTPQEQLAHGAEFSQLRGAGGQDALSEVQSTRSAGDGGFSQNSSSTGRGNVGSPGRTADQVLSDAARRLKQLGSRVQTLPPSDAAPHMTPPRMPIDHNE